MSFEILINMDQLDFVFDSSNDFYWLLKYKILSIVIIFNGLARNMNQL